MPVEIYYHMPSAFGSNYYMKFTLWARGLLSPRFPGSLRPLTTYNHYGRTRKPWEQWEVVKDMRSVG